MIRINLIASRDNRSSGGVGGGVVEFVVIMLMVAAGGAGVLFFWSNMEDRLTTAKAKVIQEQATIKGLAKARKTLKKFKGKQVELKRQLTIINKLLRSKQGPLRVLDQIIVRIPKRVWLTSIVQRKAG